MTEEVKTKSFKEAFYEAYNASLAEIRKLTAAMSESLKDASEQEKQARTWAFIEDRLAKSEAFCLLIHGQYREVNGAVLEIAKTQEVLSNLLEKLNKETAHDFDVPETKELVD